MSDANDGKISVPVPPKEGVAPQTESSASDSTPNADGPEVVISTPVLANFTPLPSAHGVTYSMI
jgi:hypothetical protein